MASVHSGVPLRAVPVAVDGSDGVWSQQKIERVALYAISGTLALSGVVGSILLASAAPVLVGLASSIFFALLGNEIIDYQNPDELALAREKAKSMSLETLLARHGWQNVIDFHIVPQDVLNRQYRGHVANLSMPEMVNYYASIPLHIRDGSGYTLPKPAEWRGMLLYEFRAKTGVECLKSYNFDFLALNGLITEDEDRFFKELEALPADQVDVVNARYQNYLGTIQP